MADVNLSRVSQDMTAKGYVIISHLITDNQM